VEHRDNSEDDKKVKKANEVKNSRQAAVKTDSIASNIMSLSAKLFLLSGSRAHEYEADKYGMHLMQKAGYNPNAAIWLQKYFISRQLNLPSWVRNITDLFSTHPDSNKRLKENQKTLKEIQMRA